ncbi:cold shock domain-containing protein membrane protein [Stutzerimonas chloritidismutans]|uniref:cold shock domain-containing protein membrane protein n=1 Tax=Stutzerimonas chloritidismutans TaxID=203192 RepID=UPI003F14D449
MLKVVHVLIGAAALLLSFAPSLMGGPSPLTFTDALSLLFIGLLNAQFAASTHPTNRRSHPISLAASALLIVAAGIQTLVLLAPIGLIAGQPATLASVVLSLVAVLLNLATTQSRNEPTARPATASAPNKPRARASAPATGRETGTVKWFNTSKGFGFISRDSGDDVFVHFRAIRGEGHRVLIEGQRVEFTIMMRDKGLQAEDVVATA